MLITADDSYRLWVNGRLIGFSEGAVNQWQQSVVHTVELDAERNVFAVRTANGEGSAAGLVAAIRIRYSDGSTEILRTGESWLAAKEIPDDFHTSDFDDTDWDSAAVQAAFGSFR